MGPSPLYHSSVMLALNFNYEQLTLKYGLHADNITRWAFKNCPSALKMTSTKDSSSNSVSKTLNKVLLWLFHFRQYCCCSPPVDAIFGLFPVGSCLFLFVLEFFLNFTVYQVPAIQSRECLVCDYQVRLFSWSMASSLVAYMSTLGRTSEDRTALAGPPVPPNPRPLSCLHQFAAASAITPPSKRFKCTYGLAERTAPVQRYGYGVCCMLQQVTFGVNIIMRFVDFLD